LVYRILPPWQNDGGVLSNVKRHFQKDHPALYAQHFSKDPLQTVYGIPLNPTPPNMEVAIDNIITWIIMDDQVQFFLSDSISFIDICKQSLSVVDSTSFRTMIMSLNGHINEKEIPHRTAVGDRILLRYKQDRHLLRQKLQVRYTAPQLTGH
jgi:hypothetical protein